MSGGLLVNLKSSAAPHPTIPRVSAFTAVSDSPDGSKSHLSGQRCLLHQVLLTCQSFCAFFSFCLVPVSDGNLGLIRLTMLQIITLLVFVTSTYKAKCSSWNLSYGWLSLLVYSLFAKGLYGSENC